MTIDNNKIVEHKSCRLCGRADLIDLFSIGNQYINDFVPKDKINQGRTAPLDLVLCNNCKLVQLRHTAPQELLYSRFYWYRSGVTETMKQALKDISNVGELMLNLKKGDIVLDIGANDGTLFETFNTKGLIKIGCEPANNLIEELRSRSTYTMHDFWYYEKFKTKCSDWGIKPKAKFITALGMFYDMEDPNQFVRDACLALDADGVFVAQLMCLKSMLEKNDIGNICHEHIEYYSLESLKYLFENNGLEIFKIEENNVNGGSYRLYARHLKKGSISFDEKISYGDIMNFKKRIDRNRDLCVDFIKSEIEKGKKVYVYGASTKGNVILQYYGLDTTFITAAVERSPEKWGKYTIGSWIPIISEKEARAAQPDYFLVLPYAFFDEMYEREERWRNKGGKFIVPLPEFRVVD